MDSPVGYHFGSIGGTCGDWQGFTLVILTNKEVIYFKGTKYK